MMSTIRIFFEVREETVATRVHQKVPDYLSGMAKEFTISGKNFVDFSAEGDRLLAGYCRDQGGGGGDPPPLMPSSSSEEAAVVRLNMEKTMAVLTRCSFNESHRQPIFLLGGIPAIADLVKVRCSATSSVLLSLNPKNNGLRGKFGLFYPIILHCRSNAWSTNR